MNTIKKTILATSAGLALVGGVVLAPLTAHGEPDRSETGRPTTSQQQTGNQGQDRKDPRTPDTKGSGGKSGSTGSGARGSGGNDGSTTPAEKKKQPQSEQQRQQQPAGDRFTCTKGTKPTPVYGKDGHITPESARQLLAAGCSANDGSELEEAANPDRHSGKSTPGSGSSKPKAPVGKQGVTQPPTKLPRVAG
ncbi:MULTISPECIES: hypothetical protein [unclassified Curtobacterium]|uniref:hypothetical protein n=1 Tax=unclassified Curtobacterium TaxID=257496 RepID=UPI00052A95B6|nr:MULTISPECIES: hypothetical protein [unclassified Curtobacterium]AIV39132.1 hypothetical protein NI26_00515 [Curtobacterium sp. MR_MD2014]MBP1301753.1 hypothetical protein [Curtobacterium sp. 1310]MCM3521209.1 hypothetical protein [Curtobacterium sp. P97]MDB6428719.1 hypothetical protein [Curtobacterium sp. 20TX0008]